MNTAQLRCFRNHHFTWIQRRIRRRHQQSRRMLEWGRQITVWAHVRMFGCEYSSLLESFRSLSLWSSWAHRLHSPCTVDTALLCIVSWNRYRGAASLMQPELCQLIMELWFRNTAQRARRIAFHFPRPAMVTTTSDRGPPYTSGCWGGGARAELTKNNFVNIHIWTTVVQK